MARCDKCLMDPCLCNIGGFGPENYIEDEETEKKELSELIDRRCIVKVTEKGNKTFERVISKFNPEHRLTDVTGKILQVKVILDSEKDKSLNELIDLHLEETENKLPEGVVPLPLFYIEYDNPVNSDIPGHMYIDEEIIYL